MNLSNRYTETQAAKEPVRVIITIEGGVVQHVLSHSNVEVVVVDYDTDGLDEDQITQILGSDAYCMRHEAEESSNIDVILCAVEGRC